MSTNQPTVTLTLDFDASIFWMINGGMDAGTISRGLYEANVGVQRILDLCDRLEVASTWFTPGHTADTHPALVERIAAAGHEIAGHGYAHEKESPGGRDETRALLRKTGDAIERATGRRPRGERATWATSAATFEAMIDEGYTYDSSLMDHCRPHWVQVNDVVRLDGPNVLGPELDLVEISPTFVTSDMAYFEFNGYGTPALTAGLRNPRDVEAIWRDEFDYIRDQGTDQEPLVLMLHPQAIGRNSRIMMLERFLTYCRESGARFVTTEQIADEFRAEAAPPGGRS